MVCFEMSVLPSADSTAMVPSLAKASMRVRVGCAALAAASGPRASSDATAARAPRPRAPRPFFSPLFRPLFISVDSCRKALTRTDGPADLSAWTVRTACRTAHDGARAMRAPSKGGLPHIDYAL